MSSSSSSLLKSEDYYRNFKNSIRSHDTFLSYDGKLKAFMRFKAIRDYSLLIEGKERTDIEKDIASFMTHLKEHHYTLASQKAYLNALVHFYSMNDVIVRRKWIGKFMSNDDTEDGGNDNGEKPYTREQIARLLEYSDIRLKVMILLMCSSGVRVGALPILRFGHLTPIPDHQIYQITVYANSKSNRYHTFCTPECRKAIDNYLNFRRQCGEHINEKSPLLRLEFHKEDIFAAAKMVKPITRDAIRKALTKLMYESGIRTPLIDKQ